jgi:hypothetical protein
MSHAKLSPSSAHRWLNCAASVAKQDGAPDQSSEFADEGTAAHTLASWTLTDPGAAGRCSEFLGVLVDVMEEDGVTVRRSFKVDDDMASYVQVYVDAIRDRVVGDAQLFVEQRLNTGIVSKKYGPITGTGDAVILIPSRRRLEIHDLKYGRGVKVFAKDNPQLFLYGIGGEHDLSWLSDIDEVLVAIHQPRLDHYDEHVYTIDELRYFGNEVCKQVEDLDRGGHAEVPGSHCKFCPRAAICKTLEKNATDVALGDFKDISDLTEHGIAQAMDKVELVELWCAAVRAEARRLLDAGTRVPGWMLAEGRQGNRKWADESKALYALQQAGVHAHKPPTLISPADAEKKLAKKHPGVWGTLQSYIVRGAPSIQMVREGSKEPLASSVTNDFKEIA